MLIIKRNAGGNGGLPQSWQGNCALPKNGYDIEIAVLSPVRLTGKLSTLFRPENGNFVGDVDLHFGADKMLFSMPGSHNRWQISAKAERLECHLPCCVCGAGTVG